ncbi:MAG TPA: class I SAM-dependent methyltransferase [Acidimicrobiales bacterium]|nr:class I SAM-dependent methyltransferase [Acidimicrobiales bacterium]
MGDVGSTSEVDPVTGRRMLTQSAYVDDCHLRSRQAIGAYAETPGDPRWRTSAVDWDGTQVVVDVGCGNGRDLRQLVPQGRCFHAFGIDLSAGMFQSLADLQGSGRLTLIQGDAQCLPLRDETAHVGLAMHMLYHVPDMQAAVRELRRVVKPGGTVLASTNSASSMTELLELADAAASSLLRRSVRVLPPLTFTTESGAAVLATEFSEVALLRQEGALSFPDAQPVVDYISTVREPIEQYLGEPFDFDLFTGELAVRVEQVVQEVGRFRVTTRTGVFVCR